MAVGEFIAARTDGLEVQIRTAPVGDTGAVSLNEVVAVGASDDVIEVRGGADELRLNDEVVSFEELEEPRELDTATITRIRKTGSLLITGDEGDEVRLRCTSRCRFVDVYVTPADTEDGTWEGLLGNNDGDASNDLQTRDGEVFEQPISFEDIHGDLADAWRITQDESLFTYEPGEDTESHTNRDFPTEEASVDMLPPADRAAAEAVCRAAGLGDHDPRTLDDCTLDFALTGDECFVWSAQRMGVDFGVIGTADDAGIMPDESGEPVCSASTYSDVGLFHPHFPGICRATALGIVLGYSDGTFRPERSVSRDQLASFVARTLEEAGYELPAATDQGFTDIDGSVHTDAINQLAAADIVQGYVQNEIFRPDEEVTRDQVASYLVRAAAWALESDLTSTEGPYFTDTEGSVHADNIDVAYELELTLGTEPGIFAPRRETTRGQTATFTSRFLDVITEPASG
jgi:hypothetical protein